jgi:hypothetical protein
MVGLIEWARVRSRNCIALVLGTGIGSIKVNYNPSHSK